MKRTQFTSEGILFAALFSMAAALFILRLLLATSYLPETGGVSINVVYGILRIINGSSLYTNPELPPFPIIQYMPLHFYIIKTLSTLFGIQNSVHGVMVLNRLFCLLADTVAVIFISRTLIKYFTIRPLFAWTLSFVYFVCIPGIVFGRGDNLYLLFFLLTISMLITHFIRKETPNVTEQYLPVLTGLTSALAVNTKQTGIFLLVVCGLFFLLHKKGLFALLKYGFSFTICSALVFLLTHPADSFYSLQLNVVNGVKNGININWFLEVFLKNYFIKFSYLLSGGLVIAILLLKTKEIKGNLFTGMALLWYFLAAILSSFKAGSGPNYYLEFILLSIFGLALLIRQEKINYKNNLLFALVISPFFLIASANDKGWGDIKQMRAAKADYQNCAKVAAYILPRLGENQWVLTNFHKESTLNLQLSDKALFPCREVALYFTRPIGVFHFRLFSELINTNSIPYVIDKKGHFPEVFLDDSLTCYLPDTTIGQYTIYGLKPVQ